MVKKRASPLSSEGGFGVVPAKTWAEKVSRWLNYVRRETTGSTNPPASAGQVTQDIYMGIVARRV